MSEMVMPDIIACDTVLAIPRGVAICPICGAALVAHFEEWEQEADGLCSATQSGTRVECTMEPDLDDEAWGDWYDRHYAHRYRDWLPVQDRVWQWVRTRYRFRVEEHHDA